MTIAALQPTNGTSKSSVANKRRYSFFDDRGVWKDAPVLIGTTKFTPLPNVKNIMVTGGAGFIACWLVRHLTLTYPQAYNIISFDKLDYCASLNNTRVLNDRRNFTFYQGDVTNPSEVIDCLERYNIDTIFHFAAQSHVDLSFGNSYGFTHTNVYGTHVLLESAKKVGIKRFIHISTDEVYGEVKDDDDDLLETSILAPTNPYAASKAAAEMLVHSYQKSFKLPAIIVRSNNVYGPHQYPETWPTTDSAAEIIPKFTCLLNRGQPVVLHGDGTPTRRYLYAGDAADAFDTILHKGQLGQIYNVGSHDEISNLSLCGKLLAEMDLEHNSPEAFGLWVKYTHDRPFNDHRYAVDGTKLRQLGWEQKTSFADGLRITVEWYRRFGEQWWGDITKVLSPFPVVAGCEVISDKEPITDSPQPAGEANQGQSQSQPQNKKRKVSNVDGDGQGNGTAVEPGWGEGAGPVMIGDGIVAGV
ncbi:dtdp-glucose-dehydratase [Bombardia bombarda]|uniref:Dtdp-glucose-dehydratase n=1 Tax=Bombardia bombarda TaxID=252184 RepID=A0AA39XAP0_9PEZI|nr:dtdp-glucose-dehydratase [Bombardia bombarda]